MENIINQFFRFIDGNNYGSSYPMLPNYYPLPSIFSDLATNPGTASVDTAGTQVSLVLSPMIRHCPTLAPDVHPRTRSP